MRTRPITFLSHSKLDKELIKRVADDLRTCRIDAWYDEWEIPPGVSFQRKIFNDGIPNCDSFFVYLTKNSAQSYWVQKELDAFFVDQSRRRNTAIITFVDSEEVRGMIPPDIASLNSPLINHENYSEGIVKLIARIFEAKLEKVLSEKSLEEENARLKLEKEVESLQKRILSMQSSGTPTVELLYEKLSRQKFKLGDIEVSSVDIFKILLPYVVAGGNEPYLMGYRYGGGLSPIITHYGFEKEAFESLIKEDRAVPASKLITPLIVNSLIDVERPTPQYDEPYLYLSDLGRRFAAFLEDKNELAV